MDDSLDFSKKLNTFNNTELTDMIYQNKNNEFKMECGNHDNITFRKESNRNNNSKQSVSNHSINNNSKNNMQLLDIPQEEEELIFHDVAEKDTEDRNKELINQIGELKNSVIHQDCEGEYVAADFNNYAVNNTNN